MKGYFIAGYRPSRFVAITTHACVEMRTRHSLYFDMGLMMMIILFYDITRNYYKSIATGFYFHLIFYEQSP